MVLNEVLGTFKGFFSRAFWFGNFLPVALFTALHLAIAWAALPNVRLEDWFSDTASKAIYFTTTFAALVVIAYASTPLVPVMRGLLDGSLLPDVCYDALRRQHLITARNVRTKINASFEYFTSVADLNFSRSKEIWEARAAGVELGRIGDAAAMTSAVRAVEKLVSEFDDGVPPRYEALDQVSQRMVEALKSNSAKLADGKLLSRAVGRLIQLLKDAEADAYQQLHTVEARYRHVAFDRPQTTRMADTRFMVESYSSNAYGVDFDYIWPRLQLVLPQQAAQGDVGSFNDKLISARAQIDFAILSLGLSLTVPVVWLPYLVWTATSPVLFLAVGAMSPLLVGFFYYVALESQIAFGEVMKGAIDSYRFKLLGESLRQTLPQTLAEERNLWAKLQVSDQAGTTDMIYYQHPKAT